MGNPPPMHATTLRPPINFLTLALPPHTLISNGIRRHGLPGSSGSCQAIAAASVADPYIALHLENGTALVLSAADGALRALPGCGPALQAGAAGRSEAQVTACALYADACGWLAGRTAGRQQQGDQPDGPGAAAAASAAGGGGSDGAAAGVAGGARDGSRGIGDDAASTYLVVCRASGCVQLLALPHMQPVGCFAVASGERLLEPLPAGDDGLPQQQQQQGGAGGSPAGGLGQQPVIVEVRMESFGALAGSQVTAGGTYLWVCGFVYMRDGGCVFETCLKPSPPTPDNAPLCKCLVLWQPLDFLVPYLWSPETLRLRIRLLHPIPPLNRLATRRCASAPCCWR